MSVESTRQASGWDCASQALAEIRACPGELEAFVSGLFDEFGKLVDDLLVHELAQDQAQPKKETAAMQEQIDRLAAMVADLAGSVAGQSKPAGRPARNGSK
jgi:predicted TPR repeat methyltransferase